MWNILTMEQIRLIVVSAGASLMASIAPTHGFVVGLLLCWTFNVWAGARADGVAVFACRHFSWSKFKTALWELLLFIAIIWLIHSVVWFSDDREPAGYAAKWLSYVFDYHYVSNAFKNLVKTYPKNKGLWMVYLVIRLEFHRLIPSHISEAIKQYEERQTSEKEKQDNGNTH